MTKIFKLLALAFLLISIDLTYTQAQTCDCTEYVYLNEPNMDATLKFAINPDGSLTEVLNPSNPNGHWVEGVTTLPHGAAMDLNGNIYVGNVDHQNGNALSGVDQYDCDGNLLQADFIPGADASGNGGVSGFATNIYTIGNTMYMNDWQGSAYFRTVFSYDMCAGTVIDQYNWCTGSRAWDFHVDEASNLIYVFSNAGVHIGDLDVYSDGTCIPVVIPMTLTGPQRGIVLDNAGNIYVREENVLRKYSPAGVLLDTQDLTINGGSNGWGMTYSQTNGYLYLGGNDADCIAVYDPATLDYVIQGAANNGGAGTKAITIALECCPLPANQTMNVTVCSSPGESHFLETMFGCAGPICVEDWAPVDGPSGSVFDSCDQSVTTTASGGCYSYEKSSTNPNSSCGVFTVTINVCLAVESAAPVISVTDNDCNAGTTGSFSVTTACDAGSSLEWSTDNGTTWTSTMPSYDSANPMTVIARCTSDYDPNNECTAPQSTPVTSNPTECCPSDNCASITVTPN